MDNGVNGMQGDELFPIRMSASLEENRLVADADVSLTTEFKRQLMLHAKRRKRVGDHGQAMGPKSLNG